MTRLWRVRRLCRKLWRAWKGDADNPVRPAVLRRNRNKRKTAHKTRVQQRRAQ